MRNASASVLTKPTFTLADRLKIQQAAAQTRDYIIIGRLTSVLFEAQRDTRGLSQSRARYANPEQQRQFAAQGKSGEAMAPFSEKQTVLWASITLDWLTHKNAPVLAISRDRHDLLLPHGMTPLPPIPDPRWVPTHAQGLCAKGGCSGCVPPRLAQKLTGCPVVGDRVRDKITARDGCVYGVIHPVLELCVMLSGAQGGFAKIRGGVDPSDGTHLAFLIDDSSPHAPRGYFVGGRFQFGG